MYDGNKSKGMYKELDEKRKDLNLGFSVEKSIIGKWSYQIITKNCVLLYSQPNNLSSAKLIYHFSVLLGENHLLS